MAGGQSSLEQKFGCSLIAAALLLWVTWAILLIGTITFRFDNFFYRRPLHNGYVLNFEFASEVGPIICRERRVIIQPPAGLEMVAFVEDGPLVACQYTGAAGTTVWYLVNCETHGLNEFASLNALNAAWSAASGGPTKALLPVASFEPKAGVFIILGGVSSFVLAILFTVSGLLLVFLSNRK